MNHFNNLVIFLLLPNLMVFLKLFIWNPTMHLFRQCLNKPVENNSGKLKDFILKVVLNQFYIPFLGMKCLLDQEDNILKDIHWDVKVMSVF